jgi:hypothetical protein
MQSDSLALRWIGVDAPIRWMHCFCYCCLVLSLPWSLRLAHGWTGALLHFLAALGGAFLLQGLMPAMLRKRPARGKMP